MPLVMARDPSASPTTIAPSGRHAMRALLAHPASPYRLTTSAIEALVTAAQITDWRAGLALLSPDEQSDLVHFLVHGSVRIEVHADRSRSSIAAFVPPGR